MRERASERKRARQPCRFLCWRRCSEPTQTSRAPALTPPAGDRNAARACISTPEIRTLTLPAGQPARLIIASDGVWDTISSEAAESISSGAAAGALTPLTCEEGAYRLAVRCAGIRSQPL